ncbi:MAG: hypothetical protein Q6365_025335 [Candidatus Sigynarchaeota archaeon]
MLDKYELTRCDYPLPDENQRFLLELRDAGMLTNNYKISDIFQDAMIAKILNAKGLVDESGQCWIDVHRYDPDAFPKTLNKKEGVFKQHRIRLVPNKELYLDYLIKDNHSSDQSNYYNSGYMAIYSQMPIKNLYVDKDDPNHLTNTRFIIYREELYRAAIDIGEFILHFMKRFCSLLLDVKSICGYNVIPDFIYD